MGTFFGGEAPSVVLAVDLRQAAEKEVGEIGEGGGPVWRNAVLDDEQGQASHERIDTSGGLRIGQEAITKGGGEVEFGNKRRDRCDPRTIRGY